MMKIRNLDNLLSATNINSSIIELDNFISDACEYGDELGNLSEPQRHFYLNQNLEREINNGGFSQFFFNSSGDFAHETVASLNAIGATHTAQILQLAIDEFPAKKVPNNRDERQEIMEQIENKAEKVWGQLDQRFLEYKDNLTQLNIDFVKKNRAFF